MRPCKVYSLAPAYSSIPPRHNQCVTGVLVASMASTLVPDEVAACDEVVYLGELPVGLSTLLSHGPRSLSAAHWLPGVEPLFMCTLPVLRGSPAKGPVCSEVSCHPGEPPWGSASSSREAPIHFQPHFTARFRAPHVHVLGQRLLQ
jgi:hypothetical protein